MGEALALLSVTLFAAGNLAIARGSGPDSEDNGAFLSILVTAAVALIAWLAFGAGSERDYGNLPGLAWFAAAGVLTIFFGRVFVFASVQHLGAVRASAVKRLNPFFSVMMGVLVLGEHLDGPTLVGMAFIFSSFAVLIAQSRRTASFQVSAGGEMTRPILGLLINVGYFYGTVSALSYAIGYVGRKQGLILIPDPAFGTLVGAVVGAVAFLLAATVLDSYRQAVRSTFSAFKPWQVASAILSSLGQVAFFAAISHTTISRVALISSMETFVTIFLSMAIFRSREGVTRPVLIAAGLGAFGTGFIVW